MAVATPPRSPERKPAGADALEALIEEARQRARRRRRIYAVSMALVALVGVALYVGFERTGQSPTASSASAARLSAAGTPRSKIAFLRLETGAGGEFSQELYVMNADGSGKRRLARSLAGNHSTAWSPDGRKLVFAIQLRRSAGPCGRAGACNNELFLINADGSVRLGADAVPSGDMSRCVRS